MLGQALATAPSGRTAARCSSGLTARSRVIAPSRPLGRQVGLASPPKSQYEGGRLAASFRPLHPPTRPLGCPCSACSRGVAR